MTKPTDSLQYPNINRAVFMAELVQHFSTDEMEQIEAAYFFSKYAHRGQERANGLRYFEHPRAVAWILTEELHIYDWQIVCEALLHDMIEDSFIMTPKRLEMNFGVQVAQDVKVLTKETYLEKGEYWDRFLSCDSWRALTCKLADRLHNLRTLGDTTPEKQARKTLETREKIFPMFEVVQKLTPTKHTNAVQNLTNMITKQVESLEAKQ